MPFVNNGKIYWNQNIADKFLNALTAIPGAAFLTATPYLRLYQTPHTPDPEVDTVASFTAADFDGAGDVALTLDSTEVDSESGGRMRFGPATWYLGDPADGTPTIYGAILTDASHIICYAQIVFDTPIPLSEEGAFLALNFSAIFDFMQGA